MSLPVDSQMTVEFVDLPDELLVLVVQVLDVVALTVAHVGETLLRFHLLSLQAVDLTLCAREKLLRYSFRISKTT